MEWCTAGRVEHLRLVIDSCYAGLTLARMMIHQSHWTKAVIRDALAACLPSQEAFELPSLGHSVLTYTGLRPEAEVLPAYSESPTEEIRDWLRARRESTQYLTNGRQHALDLINGHKIQLGKQCREEH
jgi:uncharacterized caspase-like protein